MGWVIDASPAQRLTRAPAAHVERQGLAEVPRLQMVVRKRSVAWRLGFRKRQRYIGFFRFLVSRGIGKGATVFSPPRRAQYGTTPSVMMVPFASTANLVAV
jgi:hypothetical protein